MPTLPLTYLVRYLVPIKDAGPHTSVQVLSYRSAALVRYLHRLLQRRA